MEKLDDLAIRDKSWRKSFHQHSLAKCREDDIFIKADCPQGEKIQQVLQHPDVAREFSKLKPESLARAVLEVKCFRVSSVALGVFFSSCVLHSASPSWSWPTASSSLGATRCIYGCVKRLLTATPGAWLLLPITLSAPVSGQLRVE